MCAWADSSYDQPVSHKRLGLAVVFVGIALLISVGRSTSLAGIAQSGTGWVAKRTCSGLFVAHRPIDSLVEASLPLPLPLSISPAVDVDRKRVRAAMFGSWSPSTARYRENLGCTLESASGQDSLLDSDREELPTNRRSSHKRPRPAPSPTAMNDAYREAIDMAFRFGQSAKTDEPGEARHSFGTRAVVVRHGGEVIAERYADGFDASTYHDSYHDHFVCLQFRPAIGSGARSVAAVSRRCSNRRFQFASKPGPAKFETGRRREAAKCICKCR